jgi:hypothetical protein
MKQRRSLPNHLRVQVLARDKYRCLMCGRDKSEVALEVDHVKPVAQGGTDELDNLATLCRLCNNGKSAFIFNDYRSLSLAPEKIASEFKYFTDEPVGDYLQFHVYLYFKNIKDGGLTHEKYHHSWKITGTELALSSDKEALKNRRCKEETVKFEKIIKDSLASEGRRIIQNEEGICKVDG